MNVGLGPLEILLTKFYHQDFSFEQAQELLGVPMNTQSNPNTVRLVPYAKSNLSEVELEKLRLSPEEEPLLAGVVVQFIKQPVVDFQKLRQVFGEPTNGPLMKPSSPYPVEFIFWNDTFECSLSFDVPQEFIDQDMRRVRNMILRRIPLTADFAQQPGENAVRVP